MKQANIQARSHQLTQRHRPYSVRKAACRLEIRRRAVVTIRRIHLALMARHQTLFSIARRLIMRWSIARRLIFCLLRPIFQRYDT